MELYIILAVLQSFSISLGVGSSVVALTLFFRAVKDGTIDPSERMMLGGVYITLRLAMGLILASTLLLSLLVVLYTGEAIALVTPYSVMLWSLIGILYANAVLMTNHLMSKEFGPGIQVASWSALGIVTSLSNFVIFSFTTFVFWYIICTILVIALINIFADHWIVKKS